MAGGNAYRAQRCLRARVRMLTDNPFYGVLLTQMKLMLDDEHSTAWTTPDGKIFFNPAFLDSISDVELDFVLEHEILHQVLKHLERSRPYASELYNLAADIVINSTIKAEHGDDEGFITLDGYGVSPHRLPDGSEGRSYSTEEVYRILEKSGKDELVGSYGFDPDAEDGKWGWDVHVEGKGEVGDWAQDAAWKASIVAAAQSAEARGQGDGSLLAKRLIKSAFSPKIPWQALLQERLQDSLCSFDYSFARPDRRYGDSPFIFPGLVPERAASGILLAMDASGSISETELIRQASEIRELASLFSDVSNSWVISFDASASDPVPLDEFSSSTSVEGGGGTSFECVFDALDELIEQGSGIRCVVVFTDGYAACPSEDRAQGIPVIWLLQGEDAPEPDWGVVVHLSE